MRITHLILFFFLGLNIVSFADIPVNAEPSPQKDTPSSQITQEQSEAREFIVNLGNEATSLLTSKKISSSERKIRFKDLFRSHFSTKSIAKFCLGRYWREATDGEKQKYLELFDDSVADNYASKFSQYNPEDQFVVSSVRSLPDGGIKVNSSLQTPNDTPINIVWLVYKKPDEGYKIFDVLLEGVSMSITQRSEYASIIGNSGGKISGLLSALENKQTIKN